MSKIYEYNPKQNKKIYVKGDNGIIARFRLTKYKGKIMARFSALGYSFDSDDLRAISNYLDKKK